MWREISILGMAILLVVVPFGQATGTDTGRTGSNQVQPTSIDSCTTITEPGHYVLTQDIENATDETCIEIRSSDVILNGNGHTVDGVQNATTLARFLNTSIIEGTHPEMADWKNVGIAANTSGTLSNITVQQVTVTDWFFGVYYNNISGGEVANVMITGNGDGLSLYDASNIVVSNSVISQNTGGGLNGDGANATEIRANTIESNKFGGVSFYNSIRNQTGFVGSAGEVTDNAIINNTISSNEFEGVYIETGAENTISENRLVNNSGPAIHLLFNSTANTISENRLIENGGGVYLDQSSNNRLQDTVTHDNTNWTYYSINGSQDNTVQNLTIEGMNVSFIGTDVAMTRSATRLPGETEANQTQVGTGLLIAETSQNATLQQMRLDWGSNQRTDNETDIRTQPNTTEGSVSKGTENRTETSTFAG